MTSVSLSVIFAVLFAGGGRTRKVIVPGYAILGMTTIIVPLSCYIFVDTNWFASSR
jgi:hypothetical protein